VIGQLAFKDQFDSLVNNNTGISNIDKLILLKQSLSKGTASSMVDKAELTDGNFAIYWALVKARYDNKREIGHGLLKKLFALHPIQYQSQRGLLHIVDTVHEVNTSLEQMGLNTSNYVEFIITHIIIKNLDHRTTVDFEKSLTNPNFHSLKTLIDFLTSTAGALASSFSRSNTFRRLTIRFFA